MKILQSYSILTNVIVTLHLDSTFTRQAGQTYRWTIDETYVALLSNISITVPRASNLIEVRVRNSDPHWLPILQTASYKLTMTREGTKWLHDRFEGIRPLNEELFLGKAKLLSMEAKLGRIAILPAHHRIGREQISPAADFKATSQKRMNLTSP